MAARTTPPKKRPKNPARPWGGRPTSYTPELGRKICDAVRKDGYDYVVAEFVGIHRDTLTEWRTRGRRGEQPFADFLAELNSAKADYIRRALRAIARNKDWKAKAFVLVRMEQAMNLPKQVEVSGPEGGPIKTETNLTLTLEQIEAYRTHILGLAKSGDDK